MAQRIASNDPTALAHHPSAPCADGTAIAIVARGCAKTSARGTRNIVTFRQISCFGTDLAPRRPRQPPPGVPAGRSRDSVRTVRAAVEPDRTDYLMRKKLCSRLRKAACAADMLLHGGTHALPKSMPRNPKTTWRPQPRPHGTVLRAGSAWAAASPPLWPLQLDIKASHQLNLLID